MILAVKDSELGAQKLEKQLQGIGTGLISDSQAEKILIEIGYQEPREVLRLLSYLRSTHGSSQLGDRGHRRLEKLIPQIRNNFV